MQELLPLELLMGIGIVVVFMVFMTYYGFNLIFRKTASSFSRPKMSTVFGIWTFLFMALFLGVFVMISMYTMQLGIGEDLGWLFDNTHTFIAVCSMIVAFMIPLGYLYIYRGGS
jgi:hypothetical protein